MVVNSEGDAEYTTGTLAVGAHSIAASYSGDASYNKSSSTPASVAFTVIKASTAVALSAAISTIAQGQSTTLSALVETPGAGVAPTGSVTFMAGSTTLGTVTLSPFATNYAVATYTITSAQSTALPVGSVALTATYSGDSNYFTGNTAAPGDVVDRNRSQRAVALDHDGYSKHCYDLAFRAHQPIDHGDWKDRLRGAHRYSHPPVGGLCHRPRTPSLLFLRHPVIPRQQPITLTT